MRMTSEELIRLVRQTKIFGYVGLPSSGKTLCMVNDALRLKLLYPELTHFYSNFPCSFCEYVDSLDQLRSLPEMSVFLGDDFERYVSSHASRYRKVLADELLDDILLDLAKNNVYLLYSGKRPLNLAKRLRNVTLYWCWCNFILRTDLVDREDAELYLNYYSILKEIYNTFGEFYNYEVLWDCVPTSFLYDTRFKVLTVK